MGTCNSVRQWQPGQRRSGLGKAGPGRCCWQRAQGVHPGPAEGVLARLRGPDAGAGTWGGKVDSGRRELRAAEGVAGGRRSHLTGLCSVATGSGLSWDSGAAARPGESPASMGNLRPCEGSWALMSRPRGALRGQWRSGRSRAAGRPLPAPAPWAVAHLPEAEAGPRLEAAARPLAAGGRSGPGGARQVSAARHGPGVEGAGCIVIRAAAR